MCIRDSLRTLGFAATPHWLLFAAAVPLLGWVVGPVAALWGLAAYVVAVRQALDVTTGRAVVVCLIAYAVVLASVIVLGTCALGARP